MSAAALGLCLALAAALGGCTTPVSMVLIGGILASVNYKTILSPSAFFFCCLGIHGFLSSGFLNNAPTAMPSSGDSR